MGATVLRPGDVFAVPIGDSRFGAVRVLRIVVTLDGPSALVAVTPWVGTRVPDPKEHGLDEILRRNRGHFEGRPAICWYDGTPPDEFVYVGVIPPRHEELQLDPLGAYCGPWDRSMIRDVLLERGEPVALPSRAQMRHATTNCDFVPGDMTENAFWEAISLLDWDADTIDERVEPLVDYLSRLSPVLIGGFQKQLAEKLYALDQKAIANEIGEFAYDSSDGFSPDHFLYARCAAVANGRKLYEAVLEDPRRMPKNLEFESLLSVAETAYRRQTGRTAVFIGVRDCETFSNTEGWRDKT